MSVLKDFVNTLAPWIPPGVAALIIVLVIAGIRYIINKRSAGTNRNVRRQVFTLLFSFIGLLIVLMCIPEQYMSETSRGQLLSLIGILLSASIALSSTTFVGNAMAGMMLRAIESFRPGDFVRIGEHFGRVTERGLFHVEIQTEDRDLTTLPNLYLVTNPVKVILSSGTVISAEISLGYDITHGEVERILKKAAEDSGLSDPFVLIMQLGDFSVTYRASGILTDVRHLISVRSRLREMMLDGLHRAGIEIVSPTFMNTRAVPEHKRFVPQSPHPETGDSSKTGAEIEKLIFDLADEAESLEKLNALLAETVEEMDAMKNRLKEISSEEEKEKIENRIKRFEERQEQIKRLVEKMNDAKEE